MPSQEALMRSRIMASALQANTLASNNAILAQAAADRRQAPLLQTTSNPSCPQVQHTAPAF